VMGKLTVLMVKTNEIAVSSSLNNIYQ